MRTISDKSLEEIKIHFTFSNFVFPKILPCRR